MSKRLFRIILGCVLLLTLLFVGGVIAILLLSANGEDIRHSFASPSGARTLYLVESCQGNACTHQAIIEMPGLEGGTIQVRCGLDIVASRPVFGEVVVDWTADENAVIIRYGINDTGGPAYGLDFTRDCNA